MRVLAEARTPPPPAGAGTRPRPRRGSRPLWIGVALAGAIVVAGLAVVLISSDQEQLDAQPVSVYNIESRCQRPHTHDCALGLARDPYAQYAAANVAGRVWHNDVLQAECYVPDGSRVESEDGRPSTRWYRVTGPSGGTGAHAGEQAWLPAVRLRPGAEPAVPRCTGR